MEGDKLSVSLLLFTCVFTAVHGITIEGLSGTKTAGGSDNLRITCRASSADAAKHHGLTLSRNLSSYNFQNLVTVVQENSQTVITWSDQIGDFRTRTRATATGQATSSSSSLTLDLPDFECSDAGIYKCSLNGANQDYTPILMAPSATATLSVIGRNGNMSLALTEYLEPDTFSPHRVYDDRDNNFQTNQYDQNNQDDMRNRRYYKVGTVITMECEGELSKPTSTIQNTQTQNQNNIGWYKLRSSARSWERYYPINKNDVTTRTTAGSMNSCLQIVTSTLRYNVSYILDNGGTSFRCQAVSTLGGMSESNIIRIYAGDAGDPDTGSGTASDAGMIAGIVVGVIAAIVLVVLLIIFLVFKRKNSGEAYTTKEETSRNGRQDQPKPASGNDKVFSVPMKDRHKKKETTHPPEQEYPDDYASSLVQKENRQGNPDPHNEDPTYDNPNRDKPKRGYNPHAEELHYAALDVSTNPPRLPREFKSKYSPTKYTEIQFKNN